ncbi:hypothetical protein [Bacillus mycoides]|uniref:hypothetical protein n=1 Tax=Bacillus mycoides TaxID=1405 RepID=UPI001F3EE4C4|nr:hypothetical protein [Bacillus mycoides]
MEGGCVVVDMGIEEGGILERSDGIRSDDKGSYEKEGVVDYAVGKMGGGVGGR